MRGVCAANSERFREAKEPSLCEPVFVAGGALGGVGACGVHEVNSELFRLAGTATRWSEGVEVLCHSVKVFLIKGPTFPAWTTR
jgi:hypothetical protein